MKILHILSSHIFSGAENVVCQIINMYKDQAGVEMAYCSPDGTIRSALEERGITFYPLESMSKSAVKAVIDEYQPDLVHAHDMRASLFAALACGNLPLVSHVHTNAADARGLSPKSIAYLYPGLKARDIIWVSNSALKGYAFKGLLQKKSTVLYNVEDPEILNAKMALDTTDYDFDIVFIGRMVYAKNIQKLLRILRIACDTKPDLKAAVVGTGEEEAEIKALCTKLGLDNNVSFLGYQSNPFKILHDAKIMVMTSRFEGTPMVALEAIAFGVPIVSTPTDGMVDLIEDGVNGYLTDDEPEFAKHLLDILSDESLRQSLIENQKKLSNTVNNVDNYKRTLDKIYRL